MTARPEPADEVGAGAAGRVLDVLEYLSHRSAPVPAARIGAACEIPRSSMYNLLKTLRARRFVTYHSQNRSWSLGPAASDLSASAPLFVHGIGVLRALAAESHSLTSREIAATSGLPASSVDRIIPYLLETDMLHEEDDGSYSLGLEVVGLASRVGWVDRLRIACRPHLVRLRDATQETANLVVREGDHGIYVDQVESRYALRHSGWVGRRVPLERSATGAAFADRTSAHVIADTVEPGVTAIACAILLPQEEAAISVTAPTWRIEEFGIWRARSMVEAVAREISARLTR